MRSYYDVSWAALFNRPAPSSLINEVDDALWQALGSITTFPAHDLFPTFR